MCSIFGYVGPENPKSGLLDKIRQAASDRGRDGGRAVRFPLTNGMECVLGNWRACPTPEIQYGELQPYEGLVHNGTIANAELLGLRPGEIDSQVLPRVANRANVWTLADSLRLVKGSYALACHNGESVLLACNYKPIYYYSPDECCSFYFSSMERHFMDVLPRGRAPVQVPPYSVLNLLTGESAPLHQEDNKRVVVVCSSGLDSTTAAYLLKEDGWEVLLLHFLYGCKAEGREVESIVKIAAHLGSKVDFLTVPYGQLAGNSTLLTAEDHIAGGIVGAEYALDWVPARNLVFLALAVAYGEAKGYHAVALGTNLEEENSFPDNDEHMRYLLNRAAPCFVQNGYRMQILDPVGRLMKHEIVKAGLRLGVPYHLTWSCYRGKLDPCNNCGPCFMRRTAFERNGCMDPLLRKDNVA